MQAADIDRRLATLERLLGDLDARIVPGGGSAGLVRFARVTTWDDDTLVGNLWDPVAQAAGPQITIAKPYALRKTPFHNQSIEYADGSIITYTYSTQRRRLAVMGQDQEYQIVTPDYWAGEIIDVVRGRTGISDVVWRDINSGGRQWAREAE